jgi:hypothetical protein
MGSGLVFCPLIQLYVLGLVAFAITVIWDHLRTPPTPGNNSPADSRRLRHTAGDRAEIPDAREWALRQSPQADGGNKNYPGRC